MNFHWLFGHKYKLKNVFYRAVVENSYGMDYYKIIVFGYYVCKCGKTKIESLRIPSMFVDNETFTKKIEYLRTLGYMENLEFYRWLIEDETSKEQTREKVNTQKEKQSTV